MTKKLMSEVADYINKTGDLEGGYQKTADFLKEQISKGNIVYHNEYVSVRVKPEFCKEGIKEYMLDKKNELGDYLIK